MPEIIPLDYSDLGGGLSRMMDRFHSEGTLTGDPDEDAFLRAHPEAAILGLLFDQRVRAESAFTGPKRLFDRIGHLNMQQLAHSDPKTLRETFAPPPLAVHRFYNKMADSTQKVAQFIVNNYEGEVSKMWNDGADSATISKRFQKLPGFGPAKSKKAKYVLHYLGYRDFSSEY